MNWCWIGGLPHWRLIIGRRGCYFHLFLRDQRWLDGSLPVPELNVGRFLSVTFRRKKFERLEAQVGAAVLIILAGEQAVAL